MSQKAVENLRQRIADQHKSMGKQVNSQEVIKKAAEVAERADRRNGSKR